ncbi:putative peroxisomal membrane anchor protein [Polychaeton citri CBS 116435]|uniref:Peroxisomal membrane protein PEX14 n=1 Tax=Polychaeton citri CBS 116435 TaxID=1314669 RepID=A0A9P4Q5K1_9PEZI|nr:putative peroxisomal membrane anchor protein [Polychaeton citri CBS 116435]
MVREDLIEGAITFLQDPSVSSAPLEQRISFLRSKNLTQEEIDVSLARVGQSSAASQPYAPAQQYHGTSPQQQQYGAFQGQSYWGGQIPPPEAPRRDWRDWFIMATVVGGLGYGMYWTAKRYIQPLIAPPTPPQLEQDKASIDASFDKAFALLDQLSSDTNELKEKEKERSDKLDHALNEVEAVMIRMKEAQEERERESKSMARDLSDVKDLIPKAIEKERKSTDDRLAELATEMQSLKTLLQFRLGGPQALPGVASSPAMPKEQQHEQQPSNGTPAPSVSGITDHGASNAASGTIATTGNPVASTNGTDVSGLDRSSNSSPAAFTNRFLQQGKSAIPAWQLAASKRQEDAKKEETGSAKSGTVSEEVAA